MIPRMSVSVWLVSLIASLVVVAQDAKVPTQPAIREFRGNGLFNRRDGFRFRFRRLSRNLRVLCDDDE